jgi:hypothetical protein
MLDLPYPTVQITYPRLMPMTVSLQGEYLALTTTTEDVYVLQITPDHRGEVRFIRPSLPAARLVLSPSGRYLAIYDTPMVRQVQLWDIVNATLLRHVQHQTVRRGEFPATFATIGAHELLLLIERSFDLTALTLPEQHPLWTINTGYPYAHYLSQLTVLPAPHKVLFIRGHMEGEARDSFVRINLAGDPPPTDQLIPQIHDRAQFYDYAYQLALGPAPGRAIVAYRDPEDEEEDYEATPNEITFPLNNFCGLYLRDLDSDAVIERIPYTPRVSLPFQLYATSRQVWVVGRDQVEIVPRLGTPGTPQLIQVHACHLDIHHGRLALVEANGTLSIVDIAATDREPGE